MEIKHIKKRDGSLQSFDIVKIEHAILMALKETSEGVKEDAAKVAGWMIEQYKKDGHLPAVVPPHILDKLKINKEKLYKN